jgi:ribonuclease E
MPKQIIIAEQHQVAAVFWEDQIQELVVATGNQQVGDIYLGLVENVIPGIDAAFVNIGNAERNGFIHITDLGPLKLKKTAGAITELIAPQQKVLVQVMKEPTGNKGPRLTGNITLPGRYLVLMPYGRGVNLSRRIRSEDERNRLRALAILIKPAQMGLLIRTEAEGKAEEAIIEDLEFLQKQWEMIQHQSVSTRPPALLNRDDDFIQRVLRDMYTSDVNRIVVDSPTAVKRVKQQLSNWGSGRSPEGVYIDSHRETMPILDYFRVNAAIREALKPRVDLPSGGYIIIEPTEALTVIDVNSGSFTRSATARETVLWTNSEAATEIARQLRLRNIGGVIVVDFIDMDSSKDQLKLLEHFNKALKADKARPQIAQLSALGLVELTRKRQGQNIYELFGQTCNHCGGLGHLARLPGEGEAIILEVPSVSSSSSSSRAIIEKPISLASTDIPETFLDSGEEFDNEDNGQNAEMDYSDTGNGPRRRRRRRPDIILKEDTGTKLTPVVNGTDAELDYEPPRVEERRERAPRPSRREETPLERIAVEMTPLEQDVYSLMGISPLVLVNKEVKDPRSVIVSVKTTNESPVRPVLEVSAAEDISLTPSFDWDTPQVVEVPEVLGLTVVEPPVTFQESYAEEVETEVKIFPEPVAEEKPDSPEEWPETSGTTKEMEKPIIRRRRRRSSAKEND